MAARTPRKQQERIVAVKVVASTPRQRIEPSVVRPVAPAKPIIEKPKAPTRPALGLQQRQRIMWWTVGIGATVIVSVWLLTVRYELQPSHSSSNFISDIFHSIRNLNLGPSNTTSPKQEEVQKYEQQVFPQFSK